MQAIRPKGERRPARWFIRRIQRDAVKQGLGELSGKGPFRRFELQPACTSRLQQQYQNLQVLRTQVSQAHPDLMKVFQRDIRIGLRRPPGTNF
jgi:hypothetical protein